MLRKLAINLLSVGILSFVGCQRTITPTATNLPEFSWFGLDVPSDQWLLGTEDDHEILMHQFLHGCQLSIVRGGSDVPLEWTVDKSKKSLGESSYEIFTVSLEGEVQYINYFYDTGDPSINYGGYQIKSGGEVKSCVREVEKLLTDINPEELRPKAPTPAG